MDGWWESWHAASLVPTKAEWTASLTDTKVAVEMVDSTGGEMVVNWGKQ